MRMSGRQTLYSIFRHYDMHPVDVVCHDDVDMLNCTLTSNNLVEFLSDWRLILSGSRITPDEVFLEHIFREQLKK